MINGTTQVLDLTEDYGLSVSYEFKNTLIETLTGGDYINAQWLYPLATLSFKVSWFFKNEFDYLRAFFNLQGGSANTFLFIDPVDFVATHLSFDTGMSITTQGVIIQKDGVYQLAKRYSLTTNSGTRFVDRPITRPKEGNVILYDNNNNLVSGSIDWDNGILTSGGNLATKWGGLFYLPVRFENDLFPTEFIVKNFDTNTFLYNIPELKLKEVKENDTEYPHTVNVAYDHYWEHDLAVNFGIDRMSKTDIFQAESGYEHRVDLDVIKTQITVPTQLLNKKQKEYAVGLWRLCLGNFAHIFVQDLDSQVDDEFYFSNTLSFETVSYQDNGNIELFNLNGLVFKEDNLPQKTAYCHCWLITRKDNIKKGFTNHDRRLNIEGNLYLPQGSFQATSSTRTSELNSDSTELSSVFTFNITEEDLITEKYKDALVEIFIFDWFSGIKIANIYHGNINGYAIGYLPSKAQDYQLDVLSIADKLNRNTQIQTSSTCRVKFLSQGLGQCNRPINGDVRQTRSVAVTNISGDRLFPDTGIDTSYAYGTLKFISGKLTGIEIYVSAVLGASEIVLLYPPPLAPEIGDQFEITKGCAKNTNACKDYNNIANFQGEPRLPGIDGISNTADL